jgi:hypothetical protein
MARVTIYKTCAKTIARLESVQMAVLTTGVGIEAKARRNLAATRDQGRHSIEGGRPRNTKYGTLDYAVSLVGPAPLSVEFGHFVHNAAFPRYVVGQYILLRAAGVI